ncbi:putative TFIIH basal transcription factor complex p52 subunit [Operophtera brumata]|uniref:General transcription factor IIH subunit 4 n=1 Tax=Operophtera brumata TaxID=104452 RepID=A0A0L7LTI9_OPEBR|nr:putative TFIIH basal transcription factor complex p52 subunit [Operophtera brumata]
MVVGVLTRESVRQALRGGITARQIIHYLEQHSHPQVPFEHGGGCADARMLKSETAGIRSNLLLPPTVVDQIKLWETERNRFVYTEGVVYNQFLSQVHSQLLHHHFAKAQGVLTWQSERARTMIVTRASHDDLHHHFAKAQGVLTWQSERARTMIVTRASHDDLHHHFAKAQAVLTWQSERARTMIVTRASHDDVKRFWKRYSKSS